MGGCAGSRPCDETVLTSAPSTEITEEHEIVCDEKHTDGSVERIDTEIIKSHPATSKAEIDMILEILSGQWNDDRSSMEEFLRSYLRHGYDVFVQFGEYFSQGMNKFVTLKQNGATLSVFWPSTLRLEKIGSE